MPPTGDRDAADMYAHFRSFPSRDRTGTRARVSRQVTARAARVGSSNRGLGRALGSDARRARARATPIDAGLEHRSHSLEVTLDTHDHMIESSSLRESGAPRARSMMADRRCLGADRRVSCSLLDLQKHRQNSHRNESQYSHESARKDSRGSAHCDLALAFARGHYTGDIHELHARAVAFEDEGAPLPSVHDGSARLRAGASFLGSNIPQLRNLRTWLSTLESCARRG